jgi:hypothetical protein
MIFRCTHQIEESKRRAIRAIRAASGHGIMGGMAQFSHHEFGASGQWTHWPAGKRHGYEAFIPFGALKRPAHSPSSLMDTASDILRRWP